MTLTDWLTRLLTTILTLGAVALILGSVLGQPILLGFVETGSMEPTLRPGDGFVAVPSAVAGDVETGDVVVFRAKHLQGGGLTTHRVVGETEAGYITQGDANPSSDQAADEPPVKDAQIVAEALQVDGRVVVIPHLGTAVMSIQRVMTDLQATVASVFGFASPSGPQGVAFGVLAFAVVGYAVDWWRERRAGRASERKDRSRETGTDPRLFVAVLTLFLVVGATAAMAVPSGPTEYAFVSSSHDTPGTGVIGTGETESTTHTVVNGGAVPVVVFFETGDRSMSVEPTELPVPARDAANATVTLTAPPETGYYRHFLVEHRYLALLPLSTIRTLYHVHPWLPIVAIDTLLGVPFYLLGSVLVGRGRVRARTRPSPSIWRRLRDRVS
jgi:signal peptidase